MSFLVIDIGNTRLKWATYDQPRPGAVLQAQGAVPLEAVDSLAQSDWQALAPPAAMLGCAVAGEVVRRRAEEQLEPWGVKPHWITSAAQEGGVVNGYEHPHRLGSDRWAALVGARARALAGGVLRPAIVVMVGTAVTVDALSRDGRFLGGFILPGFGLMLKALESGTAGLRVPPGEVSAFPTNTSDALMSGGTFAITGAIERMHRHLAARDATPPALYMTGGAAVKIAPETPLPFEVVDTLIFEGLLRLAMERPGA